MILSNTNAFCLTHSLTNDYRHNHRTTATTLASIQAAAKEMRLENNKNVIGNSSGTTTTRETTPDLGGIFMSAMKAAQKAGRIVDNIEMLEKSEVLESQ